MAHTIEAVITVLDAEEAKAAFRRQSGYRGPVAVEEIKDQTGAIVGHKAYAAEQVVGG